IYEKFIIEPDKWTRKAGTDGISYKKPSNKNGRLGSWSVKEWAAPTSYDNLAALVTANSNNPTILWMYDLREEFVEDSVGPKYDAEEKSYKFGFKFKPTESTEEYRKVMLTQLETNAGMPIDGLEFKQLMLEVVLWENGMIRAINVSEIYHMKMYLGKTPIDSDVKLTATQLFSYNPDEEGYKIQDHIDAF
ncbi:MAG: hypothetical protein K2I23_03595, partial [Clostridia bacterium]|nr:hypothetical protein [Clostridia bacterium]